MNTLSKEQIEGTYEIQVHAPMGVEHGTMVLSMENGSLSGTITNKKGNSEFNGGTVINNEIQFSAKINTPMGRLKAHITGVVENETFTGMAKLPLGTAKVAGKKIV